MAEETPEKTASESPDAAPPAKTGDPAPGPAPGPTQEAAPESAPEPTPLEVPLEEQLGALPPLEYPGGSRDQDFDQWAADKRRGRIRTEIVGGVLIILGGAVASVVTGKSAFFVLAIFGVGALAAYEFLVTSFE
jgi:hypothetical protein